MRQFEIHPWVLTSKGCRLLSPNRDNILTPNAVGVPDSVWQAANFSFCEGSHLGELFILSGKHVYTYQNGTLKIWASLPAGIVADEAPEMTFSTKNGCLYLNFIKYRPQFYIIKQNEYGNTNSHQILAENYADIVIKVTRIFTDSILFYTPYYNLNLKLQYKNNQYKLIPLNGNRQIFFEKILDYIVQNGGTEGDAHSAGITKIKQFSPNLWAFATTSGTFIISYAPPKFHILQGSTGYQVRGIGTDAYGHIIYATYGGLKCKKTDQGQVQEIHSVWGTPWNITPLNEANREFILQGEGDQKHIYFLKATPSKVFLERIDSIVNRPACKQNDNPGFCIDPKFRGFWHSLKTTDGFYLLYYNLKTHQNTKFYPIQPSGNRVLALSNDLWVGGTQGLKRFISPDFSTCILKDISNTIPEFVRYQQINALYFDKQGLLWIGVNKQGLIRFNPERGTYQQYTTTDGLAENTVFSILAEPNDSILWIGTAKGLSRFDVRKNWFDNYYKEDGLAHNEFNIASTCLAPDGTIYMGGQNGISWYHLDSFQTLMSSIRQNVLIKLSGANEAIDSRRLIISDNATVYIEPNIQLIEFAFGTDDCFHSENLKFKYRIAGLIDTWQYIDPSEKALLTKIASGKYVLEVQAQTYRGMWTSPVHYTLNILPKWYETWWFRTLIVCSVAAILYGLYRIRIRQLRKEFELRQQISDDLHDELGSRIYLLRTLSHKITNPLASDTDKKSNLDRFEETSQEAFKSIRDFIWAFNPKEDEAQQLFDRMEDFAENYLTPIIDTVNIHRSDIPKDIKIGPRAKHHLMNIYQELLTNMVKHTQSEAIDIFLSLTGNTLSMEIRNRHNGYQAAKSEQKDLKSGKGSLQNRLAEINAELTWKDTTENLQTAKIKVRI
jgi:two-component sensor histidine kinase